jgi:hypothetical protein
LPRDDKGKTFPFVLPQKACRRKEVLRNKVYGIEICWILGGWVVQTLIESRNGNLSKLRKGGCYVYKKNILGLNAHWNNGRDPDRKCFWARPKIGRGVACKSA